VSPKAIVFTEDHVRIIREDAQKAYPAEACGLITGRITDDGYARVHRVVAADNILASAHSDRFEVDPATRIRVEKEIRGSDEILIGHYHSHPDHPALPSETDLQKAYEPNLIWVIAGVTSGSAKEIKAHRLDDDASGFSEIDLVIEDV